MVRIASQRSTLRQMKSDVVACFVAEDATVFRESMGALRKILGKKIDQEAELGNFRGKDGELLTIPTDKKLASPLLMLVGLGEGKKVSLERYRRAAANAAKRATALSRKRMAFELPSPPPEFPGFSPLTEELALAVAEGAVLSLYKFDKYITEKKDRKKPLAEITLFSPTDQGAKDIKHTLEKARILCEATWLARDLQNAPGNEIYPETLSEAAKRSANQFGYSITIWDKKRIEREGFGGLLAVNSGSARPPRFTILEHNGGRRDLDTIVLVGKGITFDAGGISIKPATGMAGMKMDMSGAAAVIAVMETAARLHIPLHLVGLIPSTENMPGGSAMRPGDIVTHYGGRTSEVDNTDAEGRLILADALAYAGKYKPAAIIDLATLTGACVVALGSEATGMMGNDERIMDRLKKAGEKTYDRVWQLPLFEEYEKQIKSDVADVKNVGGRWAGAITAALFLKKFVGEYPWVHLDIAGTAILEEDQPYAPKGGSGAGVRLLIEFLTSWSTEKSVRE